MPETADIRTDAAGNTFLSLPKESKVFTATPFLQWREHDNLMEIPVHLGIFLLLPSCSLCDDAIANGDFDDTSPLTFNLLPQAWSRIITSLAELGVFDTTIPNAQDLHQNLSASKDQHVPSLTINGDDLRHGEAFDLDPAEAPARRTSRSTAAQAPDDEQVIPGPADLRFISLTRIHHLTQSSYPTLSPLTSLVGVMGQCLTRRVRSNEMANVRIIAAIIRQGINTILGTPVGAGFGNPVLAATMCEFLTTVVLHPRLKDNSDINEAALRQNIVDAIMCAPLTTSLTCSQHARHMLYASRCMHTHAASHTLHAVHTRSQHACRMPARSLHAACGMLYAAYYVMHNAACCLHTSAAAPPHTCACGAWRTHTPLHMQSCASR